MSSCLLPVLIIFEFYEHVFSYNLPHQHDDLIPFMQNTDFSGLQINRQYVVDPNIKLKCGWNTTLKSPWPPTVAQDSLLFDEDVSTLTCLPYSQPVGGVAAAMSADTLTSFAGNLAMQAYLQNGSSFLQFNMTFDLGRFTLPVNRSFLNTNRGIPALPWEVQVFASVIPPSADYQSYYKNSFTILDPFSDPYDSWKYGTSVQWTDIPNAATTPTVFYVNNPCAPQVVLYIIPGTDAAGSVFVGRAWTKAVDPPPIDWFKANLGANCKVTGATGLGRYVILQTDTCGYWLSDGLAVDVFNSSAPDGVSSLTFSGDRTVKFKQVTNFGASPTISPVMTQTTGLGDLSLGGPGSWCYLRRNIQPSTSSAGADAMTPSDWLSIKNATTNLWSLIHEPLASSTPITAISSFNLTIAAGKIRMNAAYSKALFPAIQTHPENIVSAYINTPTSTYFFLVKNPAPSNNIPFSLYSQALEDTLTSSPTVRLIYNFSPDDDMPLRIISHPTITDLFVLGDQAAYFLSSSGGSLKKLIDLRKFAPPTRSLSRLLFGQNGTLSYFVTTSLDVYRGITFYGGYIPVKLDATVAKPTGVLVDTGGKLHSVAARATGLLTTPIESAYLDLSAVPQKIPTEALTGYFSIVPFTRKTWLVVQWGTSATTVLQFTPGDIGRMLVQTVGAGDTTAPGKAHIVGFRDLTRLTGWPTGSFVPVSYIITEAVSPFFFPTTVTASSFPDTLTITLNADRTVSLSSTTTNFAQYATVFVELPNNDGSTFRGSFAILTATTTSATATALLVTGGGSLPKTITCPGGHWKMFQLSLQSSITTNAIGWTLQDHWYCPFEFLANQSTIGPWDHHMDRGDTWNLTMVLRPTTNIPPGEVPRKCKGTFMPNYLMHKAGNPWRLHVRSEMLGDGLAGWTLQYSVEEVGSDFNEDNTVTSLSFRMGNPTQGCAIPGAVPVTVISGCLRGTGLTYVFPDGKITPQEWDNPTLLNKIGDYSVGPIPVNYRPPSANGTAFPSSKILYNADSNQPFKAHFSRPADFPAAFGCSGNNTKNCIPPGTICSTAQRADSSIINCINRTVYLPFSGDHYFNFRMLAHMQDSGPLDPTIPLEVTELNGRVDYVISLPPDNVNFVFHLLSKYPNYPGLRLSASGSTIRFFGTGLYHFQVTKAWDYSYCNNSVYFTFWLYSATLPFPMGVVCLCAMALLIALWLFPALIYHGDNSLLDYRRHSAWRPPTRVPLRDSGVDADPYEDFDLEAEVDAMKPRRAIKDEEEDLGDGSRSAIMT